MKTSRKVIWVISLLTLAFALLPALPAARAYTPQLQLVQAVNLPGSFTGNQAIWVGSERVFTVSRQGDLFILARNRDGSVTLETTVHLSDSPLTAMTGQDGVVYITGTSGDLWIFFEGRRRVGPQLLAGPLHLSEIGLSGVAAAGGNIYISTGGSRVVADDARVYHSALNEGEVVIELEADGTATDRVFGETFIPNATVVYDRVTGGKLIEIGNPGTVALYVDEARLIQTVPGCCGAGAWVYDKSTLALDRFVAAQYANAVVMAKQKGISALVMGTEAGEVELYSPDTGAEYNSLNLRTLTNHTGSEDIEIRAIQSAGGKIFAASSWPQDPGVPSFFVLGIK